MASQAETSIQAELEGSDELKVFLMEHASELKNSFTPIYDALIKIGLDKVELLEFEASDLTKTLQEEGVKSLHIGRLKKSLRKIPQSQIYIESQQKQVVVISYEEERALNDIDNANKELKQNMGTIIDTMSELTTNYQTNEDAINAEFDKIINTANRRRDRLLEILRNLKEDKNNKLQQQMNIMKEYEQQLDTCRDNAQQMIQNTSIDAVKRKNEVVTASSDLLKSAGRFTALKLATTSTVHVDLDSQQIVHDIAKCGSVFDGDFPRVKTKGWKFNQISEGFEDWLKDDGKTLVFQDKEPRINACCSTGYNSGVHQFKIKVEGNVGTVGFCTSDRMNTSKQWICDHNSEHYYIHSVSPYIWGKKVATDHNKKMSNANQKLKGWTAGDIIIMMLNCDQGKLSFQIGDLTSTISVGRNKTYYPLVCGHAER
eukprot:257874_1